MTLRLVVLAASLLLAAVATAVTAPIDAAAQQDGDAAPVEVIIDLRVWQHVDEPEDIQVSARPLGGDWGTVDRIPFPLDNQYRVYRYGDLAVAGATLRIWQYGWDAESISVCAHRCPDPAVPTIPSPLGRIPLPLDDGHSPDGQYRYGDLIVATVPGNPGLLADRVQLLRLRDTLAGTGRLDWDHDTPMTTWTGVTIGGTPPRVRKLSLTGSGLTGELTGLLGELTSLEELRLDGNALTGAIPSKLGQLTRLTHVYLGGNALTSCVPPSLHAVANNDLASLGLPDCLPPTLAYGAGKAILSNGSYLLGGSDSPLILDVPAGIRITIQGYGFAHESRYWLVLEHVDSQSRTRLNLPHNNEWGRETDPRAPAISAALDRIIESAWLGALDTPYTQPPSPVRPALTAVSGGDAGEILLEWTIAEEGATRWQYRQSGPGEDAAWGAWTDIPSSDANTMSHRLSGLQPEQLYQFEVRAWTADGAGDASSTREAIALRAGPDRIPIALPGTALGMV